MMTLDRSALAQDVFSARLQLQLAHFTDLDPSDMPAAVATLACALMLQAIDVMSLLTGGDKERAVKTLTEGEIISRNLRS